MGIGGLGFYAIQYAGILGSGASVVALDRSDEKLEMAKDCRSRLYTEYNRIEVRSKVDKITNGQGVDVVLDTVGLESTIKFGQYFE